LRARAKCGLLADLLKERIINRIFGYVYHVRLLAKRMKVWNKRICYTVKYLVIGGLVAAFLASAFA
jgi:beta-hydroxylase